MNLSKSILTLAAIGFSLANLAQAEIKVATVDLAALFDGYYKTAETQKVLNLEQAKLQKDNDERLTKVQELKEKHDKLRKNLEDPSINEAKKVELMKEFESVRQEGTALERERLEFIERRRGALNEKAREDMKVIFDEINEVVKQVSKTDEYDYVFNKSAAGANGIPFLLYASDASDITEKLAAQLAESQPK